MSDSGKNEELETVISRPLSNERVVLFLSTALAELMDEIMEAKRANPDFTMNQMMAKFEEVPGADALTRIVYDSSYFDFILKFEDGNKPFKKLLKLNIELLKEGLILELEPTIDKKGTYIKILAPFERLCDEAKTMKLRMPLAHHFTKSIDAINRTMGVVKSMFRNPELSKATAVFNREKMEIFVGGDASKIPFYQIQLNFFPNAKRNLMVYNIITRVRVTRYSRFVRKADLNRFLADKVITDAYPLHDGPLNEDTNEDNLRAKLYRNWPTSMHSQPLDDIRNYYGEKMGMYFAWLGLYTKMLFFAGILGALIMFAGVWDTISLGQTSSYADVENFGALIIDNPWTIVFAFCMAVWSTLFLELWNRKAKFLAYKWDVIDFKKVEMKRPQWFGTHIRISPVTGKKEFHYPFYRRFAKQIVAMLVVLVCIAIVITGVGCFVILRLYLTYNNIVKGPAYYQSLITTTVVATLNLAFIMGMNMMYGGIAVKLTDWENHSKDSQYRDALVFKTFLFDFVNYYSSLIYIGIIKPIISDVNVGKELGVSLANDTCSPQGCLIEVTIQLLILFCVKEVIRKSQDVLVPDEKRARRLTDLENANGTPSESEANSARPDGRLRKHTDGKKRRARWVLDDRLMNHHDLDDEYRTIIIQFGFIALFSISLPIAPLLAWFSNLLEIKTDSYKLLSQYQRSVAHQSDNIGMWYSILRILSTISVIVNAAIISVTSRSYGVKSWICSIERTFLQMDNAQMQYSFGLNYTSFDSNSCLNATNQSLPCMCNGLVQDIIKRYDTCSDIFCHKRNCDYLYTSQVGNLTTCTDNKFIIPPNEFIARIAFVVGFLIIVYGFKAIFSSMIPDVPSPVRRALEREEYMAKIALDKGLEEEDEELDPSSNVGLDTMSVNNEPRRLSFKEAIFKARPLSVIDTKVMKEGEEAMATGNSEDGSSSGLPVCSVLPSRPGVQEMQKNWQQTAVKPASPEVAEARAQAKYRAAQRSTISAANKGGKGQRNDDTLYIQNIDPNETLSQSVPVFKGPSPLNEDSMK